MKLGAIVTELPTCHKHNGNDSQAHTHTQPCRAGTKYSDKKGNLVLGVGRGPEAGSAGPEQLLLIYVDFAARLGPGLRSEMASIN